MQFVSDSVQFLCDAIDELIAADDEPAILYKDRTRWDMSFANGSEEALRVLAIAPSSG